MKVELSSTKLIGAFHFLKFQVHDSENMKKSNFRKAGLYPVKCYNFHKDTSLTFWRYGAHKSIIHIKYTHFEWTSNAITGLKCCIRGLRLSNN